MFNRSLTISAILALSILGSACQPSTVTLEAAKDLLNELPVESEAPEEPVIPVDTTTDIKEMLLTGLEGNTYEDCVAKTIGGQTRYFRFLSFTNKGMYHLWEEISEYWDDQCTSVIGSTTHNLEYTILEMKRVDGNNNYTMKLQAAYQGNASGGLYGQPYNDMMAFLAESSSEVFPMAGQVIDRPIHIAADFNLVRLQKGNTTIPLPKYVYVAPPPQLFPSLYSQALFGDYKLCETIVRSGVTKHFQHTLNIVYNVGPRGGSDYYTYSLSSLEMTDASCSFQAGPAIEQFFRETSSIHVNDDYLEFDVSSSVTAVYDENSNDITGGAYNSTMVFLTGAAGTFPSGNLNSRFVMSVDWRSVTLPLGSRTITLSMPEFLMGGGGIHDSL